MAKPTTRIVKLTKEERIALATRVRLGETVASSPTVPTPVQACWGRYVPTAKKRGDTYRAYVLGVCVGRYRVARSVDATSPRVWSGGWVDPQPAMCVVDAYLAYLEREE